MKQKKNFLAGSLSGLKVLFRLKTNMMLFYVIFAILHGLSWALQIIFMQRFFDSAEIYSQGKLGLTQIVFALLAMGLTYIFSQIMNGVFNCFGQICNLAVGKELNKLIFRQIDNLDVSSFEDTKRLEDIDKAVNGSKSMFWVCTTVLDVIFFYGTYFIAVGGYLFKLKPVLGISIVIIFVPSVVSKLLNIITFRKLEDESVPLRRQAVYFEKCMTDKEYLKESRILGVVPYFEQLYHKVLSDLGRLTIKAQSYKSIVEFCLSLITVICYGAVIYLLFISVMSRSISIGAFAAVLASINRIYGFVNEVVSERFGWASENIVMVENFMSFIDSPLKKKEKMSVPEEVCIRLDGVSYVYPNSSKKALDNISFTIGDRQTVAIVGENGSGKTTLCRTIMGLYSPSEGTVFYNNIPISSVSWTDGVSAVFQKYCKYKMTLRDNICISDIDKVNTDSRIKELCRQCRVNLGQGYDTSDLNTFLGRNFDGIEISGGQWQRIAIARGLYRDSNLIILDEPTAAIDPMEETRLYFDFAGICEKKTAIIVTHRLASAQIADRIIVLKEGKVVQDGSHEELLRVEGEYKRMYELQQKWYAEQKDNAFQCS